MVCPDAVALERLLAKRRSLSGGLLYGDAFDRWGPKEGPEYDRVMAETAEMQSAHARVTAEVEALSGATWRKNPSAIVEWAQAHVDLLERFIAANAGDEAQSTGVFVAKQEIEAWGKVARGELAYVDENGFYVHVDAGRQAEHFGALS